MVVSEDLKNDFDIVQEAVSQNWQAIEFIGSEMRNDYRVAMNAIRINPEAFEYLSEEIRSNPEIVEFYQNQL